MIDQIEVIQHIGEGLILSCPFNVPVNGCLLNQFRSLTLNEVSEKIKQIEINNLISIMNYHSDCFKNRVNEYDKVYNDKLLNISKTLFLKWTGKTNIGILTFELRKRNWIKSQNEFSKLFSSKIREDHIVRWNITKREELSYLLFCLRKKEMFCPIGSKGFYNFVEDHITGFNNEIFAKNQLKKLSSTVNNDPETYREIITCVNEIMELL